jgi:Cof subfamily protein (haloacid dehalogenase superfamily)
MKKILFVDLDGTLLNSEKLVSEGNRAAIQRFLDAGHYLVVATGRPVKSGFKVVKSLGLTMPGCYMIAYNGGTIFDCSKQEVWSERTLPIEYVKHLFEEAKKCGLHIQTYGVDDKVLTMADTPELQFYLEGNRNALDHEICDDVFAVLGKEPSKAILIDMNEEKLIAFRDKQQDWAAGKCESTFSSRQLLEYLPIGVSKGNGVRMLCEMLDVKIEDAYAAGDERNDISMLEAAGVGIAMQNAVDEVKAVADYVTENDNNHDGIAEVIDKLILGA